MSLLHFNTENFVIHSANNADPYKQIKLDFM